MKAFLLLLFTIFFFASRQTCLAQAPTEKPTEEQAPAEEPSAEEAPNDEAPKADEPSEEPPKGKKKKSKKVKEKVEETPAEEPPSDEAPADEPPKEKRRKKKGKKNEIQAEDGPADGSQDAPEEEEVPTEAPPAYKDDKKKDTWFRVFKMKRCPIKSCETKMVHIHNGKKFRGRKKLKIIQNPKTGELNREPVTDPIKRKKSKKVKKNHEYQKEFKLPEKSN